MSMKTFPFDGSTVAVPWIYRTESLIHLQFLGFFHAWNFIKISWKTVTQSSATCLFVLIEHVYPSRVGLPKQARLYLEFKMSTDEN